MKFGIAKTFAFGALLGYLAHVPTEHRIIEQPRANESVNPIVDPNLPPNDLAKKSPWVKVDRIVYHDEKNGDQYTDVYVGVSDAIEPTRGTPFSNPDRPNTYFADVLTIFSGENGRNGGSGSMTESYASVAVECKLNKWQTMDLVTNFGNDIPFPEGTSFPVGKPNQYETKAMSYICSHDWSNH